MLPIVHDLGSRLSSALGVTDDLQLRFDRVHASLSVSQFRSRQLGSSVAAFAGAAFIVVSVQPPPALVPLFLLGAPFVAFLVLEQLTIHRSAEWQRRVFLELPVVSEQLGMLLSAGYSVGAAINRLAERGCGACTTDLRRVASRIRHGLAEDEALAEWAAISGVDAVERLVAVLALDRDAADLGRLISETARATRHDVHRELIETIERRSQQVWIPVTVATLLPGVLFLAVPFVAAMQLFTGQ